MPSKPNKPRTPYTAPVVLSPRTYFSEPVVPLLHAPKLTGTDCWRCDMFAGRNGWAVADGCEPTFDNRKTPACTYCGAATAPGRINFVDKLEGLSTVERLHGAVADDNDRPATYTPYMVELVVNDIGGSTAPAATHKRWAAERADG